MDESTQVKTVENSRFKRVSYNGKGGPKKREDFSFKPGTEQARKVVPSKFVPSFKSMYRREKR